MVVSSYVSPARSIMGMFMSGGDEFELGRSVGGLMYLSGMMFSPLSDKDWTRTMGRKVHGFKGQCVWGLVSEVDVFLTLEVKIRQARGVQSFCRYKKKGNSLSTLHFLKILENSLEVLKVLKNSLEVLKVVQMELQENSLIDKVGDPHRHPTALAKSIQYQKGCFQGPSLGYRPYDQDLQCGEDQGSRSLARLRDEMRQSSTTQEYPSLIDTFFVVHTVNGELLRDEDRRIYEEMRRLEATSTYTDDEINRLSRGGKQRGHILGVGRVLPARATASPSTPAHESTLISLHKKVDFMMSLFKSDSKYSDMFSQFESGGVSGSGGCGDDEESADDQDDEDEDGDDDT
nr:F-box domain, leucine-rich repeat domain, L domain-like protein [Tanacetum cinerariifolium]